MIFIPPRRFSRRWWLLMAAVTVVLGAAVLMLLRLGLNLGAPHLLLAWLLLTLVGDVIAAILMEAIAPTRVTIGPRDRLDDDDLLAERAVVTGEFDEKGQGRVWIRGESWLCRMPTDEDRQVQVGDRVRVLRREGLVLVVCGEDSDVKRQ